MTHRFLHIGDTHLSSTSPRNADRLATLDQIVALGAGMPDLAAWLWPGDLFHAKSSIDDRNALAERLLQMAARAPVIICPGNHDQPGDLEIFARLRAAWPVHVVSVPSVIHVPSATGPTVACFVLPYPHRAGLVGAGIAHTDLGQAARAALRPIILAAAAELEASAAAGEIPLFIGHVNVCGAISSTGQPQIGLEIELDGELLIQLGEIYLGLNHIHRHQVVHGAVYAGSICRLDFAEMEPKGVIEIEVQRDGTTWEHRWAFRELVVPGQHQIDGRLTREAFILTAINGDLVSVLPAIDAWRGSDVRVRYTFNPAEVTALDIAKIHAEFAGCRSLKIEPLPDRVADVRAPEIAAATTLEAKVEAFCARQRVPWSPGLLDKLTALQSQDAEAVLAAITAQASGTPTPTATPVGVDV